MEHDALQGLQQTQHDATVTLVSIDPLSHVLHKKMIEDCNTLPKMELRRRYSAEANAHRNMLARGEAKGVPVDPDLRDFANFLRIMGPMPAGRATIDRINNDDPEYAPGKIRWADKRTQNNNKSDTLIFHRSATGETFTASRLAKMQGVTNSTIRKRRERGWTDNEIIDGSRSASTAAKQPPSRPGRCFPVGLYYPKQLEALSRPESHFTHAADIHFHRTAHEQQSFRENNDGEEYFPATYEEMVEEVCNDADRHEYWFMQPGARERIDAHIARLWHRFKAHCFYDRLTPAQKQCVARIDPEYIQHWNARIAELGDLKY
jgi:hypothetical protein